MAVNAFRSQGGADYAHPDPIWIKVTAELSYGLPRLIETLVQTVLDNRDLQILTADELTAQLAGKVREFIKSELFKGIPEPWPDILNWASVPKHFDALSLRRCLQKADPSLDAGKEDYFYIQGIQDLRLRYTLVSSDQNGNRLSGVLRDIVRTSFQLTEPEKFQRAEKAWNEVLAQLKQEISEAEEAWKETLPEQKREPGSVDTRSSIG